MLKNKKQKIANNIKTNSKGFFAYIRNKQRSKDKVGPLKDHGGNVIIDDLISANYLNDYFGSVFTNEDIRNIPQPNQKFNAPDCFKLNDIEITEDEVFRKLDKLKVDKSPGGDNIHPKLLFELRHVLAAPLTAIYNKSLKSGEVPSDWREATITALFKKGNRSDPANYRPVSLTSINCKILESIVKDKIVSHLLEFKLINDSQLL